MKKLFLISGFLLAHTSSFAQRSKFQFEIFGGAEISAVKFEEASEMASESATPINFSVGASLLYLMTSSLRIGSSLIYSDKGFVRNNNPDSFIKIDLSGKTPKTYDIDKIIVRANYLEIPVFLNYSVKKTQYFGLHLVARYIPSFLLNSWSDIKYSRFKHNTALQANYKNNISSFVSTVQGGVGTEFKISPKAWFRTEGTLRAHLNKIDHKNMSRVPYPGFGVVASFLFDFN